MAKSEPIPKIKDEFYTGDQNGALFMVYDYAMPYQKYQKRGKMNWMITGKSGDFSIETYSFSARFNLFAGAFFLGETQGFFHNFAPFEVVDDHQWNGEERSSITHYDQGRYTKGEQERACWQIASFDEGKGERFVAAITHASRDDVFKVQNRLNQVLAEAKRLTQPYMAEIRANYRAEKWNPETDEDKAMMAEILADWKENGPLWEWD